MAVKSRKRNEGKRPIAKPSKDQARRRVIGDWLCRYALVFRDAAGLPAQISGATVDAYDAFLWDCDPIQLEEAMRAAGAMARYFPRVEQIRACYFAVLERVSGSPRVVCECGGSGFVQRGQCWAACLKCSPGTAEKRESQ